MAFGARKKFKASPELKKVAAKFQARAAAWPKMPSPETPPVFCTGCLFYDFAKRDPNGASACNFNKFVGQQAALVRADEKKCGMKGKYFKAVKDKTLKERMAKLEEQHKAAKAAAKTAANERGSRKGRGRKFTTKTFGKRKG